jgi:hypothetical protein
MAPKKQAKSTTSTAKTNIARSDTTSWDASQETTAAKMNSLMEMRKSRVGISSFPSALSSIDGHWISSLNEALADHAVGQGTPT